MTHEQLFSLTYNTDWLCGQCPGTTILAVKSFTQQEKLVTFNRRKYLNDFEISNF